MAPKMGFHRRVSLKLWLAIFIDHGHDGHVWPKHFDRTYHPKMPQKGEELLNDFCLVEI